jgi:hypothetical protein
LSALSTIPQNQTRHNNGVLIGMPNRAKAL